MRHNIKHLKKIVAIVLSICCLSISINSCSDDDISSNEIIGTWYATTSGGKASITLTFNSDHTGYLHYCWDNVRYHVIEYVFTYKINGNEIKTNGTVVDSDEGESSGSMNFKVVGDKIIGGRWHTDNDYSK